MLDETADHDAEFSAALRYFLRQRGWTSQDFCDRTRLEPGSPRRIVPSSVSDWAKRSQPSNRATMITCKTLGVARSYFFEIGEQLVRAERDADLEISRLRAEREGDVEVMSQVMDRLSERALENIGELRQTLQEQRAELGKLMKNRGNGGQSTSAP